MYLLYLYLRGVGLHRSLWGAGAVHGRARRVGVEKESHHPLGGNLQGHTVPRCNPHSSPAQEISAISSSAGRFVCQLKNKALFIKSATRFSSFCGIFMLPYARPWAMCGEPACTPRHSPCFVIGPLLSGSRAP